MDAIKSWDNRTVWTVTDAGELVETGSNTLKYTIDAVNVVRLLDLLQRNEALIREQAEMILGISVSDDDDKV